MRSLKDLLFYASTREDLRAWPEDARRVVGHELLQVQRGLAPSDFKPMPTVGLGVYEIRVRTALQHRVFYVARFDEAVYVLHVFEKRSRKTPRTEIELGRARLAALVRERSGMR